MDIMVAIKRVLDYRVPVRIQSDGSDVDLENLKMSINPFDEIALEEAIRLKEKGFAEKITVVSIGDSSSQESLRAALAMGADHAILIETTKKLEPLWIAQRLKQLVMQHHPGLIILGKQAIDSDDNQVGQMLAGLLDYPQGTFISKLTVMDAGQIEVTREVDGGLQTLRLNLPAVVTTDLRLNEPRYTSLINIMKAKTKPFDIIPLEPLPDSPQCEIHIQSVSSPSKKRAGKKCETVSELIDYLKNEKKVI